MLNPEVIRIIPMSVLVLYNVCTYLLRNMAAVHGVTMKWETRLPELTKTKETWSEFQEITHSSQFAYSYGTITTRWGLFFGYDE
jgi:hypothetical protein